MSIEYLPPDQRAATCNECGTEFQTREQMIRHVYQNHSYRHLSPGQRPHNRGPIPCGHPGCDFSFNTRSAAYQHYKAKHITE
jgi:hypothetical protein